jgi:hypothetical protein
MAECVKVEIDLATGRLVLECQESSVDSVLTRLADFLPKFREQAQPTPRQAVHHAPRVEVEQPDAHAQAKASNGSGESGAKKRISAAARAGGASEARSEVQNLQLNVDEPGLLPWRSLSKDWEKYLWLLEAARMKGIDGLTNSEISFLMNKTFREVRAAKVVNNLKNKIKDRFVQSITINAEGKTYSTWRILSDGSKQVVQPPPGAAKA